MKFLRQVQDIAAQFTTSVLSITLDINTNDDIKSVREYLICYMVNILAASINLNNNRTAVFIRTCQPGEKEVFNILIAILIVIKFISGDVKKITRFIDLPSCQFSN